MRVPSPTRPLATLAAGLLLVAALRALPATELPRPDDPLRQRWMTSRFRGTPEPPPPFRAEPAFPNLTFRSPVLIVHAPGTDRLFVGELGGRVLSFPERTDAEQADPALDLAARPVPFAALYGMAFHPDFARNHQVFLCYVTRNGDEDGTRVSRFRVEMPDDGPPRIDPDSEEVLLTFLAAGHNGGCLQFGPDGCLYISTGDAADPAPPDPLKTGQDISDLLSSILRIDVDRRDEGLAYRVPPDNPFVDHPGARPEVWAYGLRNPWRFSFDAESGDLWVGDVGWELWELIFRVEPGMNCGWALMEGPQPVRADIEPGPTPVTPPIVAHPHSEAASMTGGYVSRGDRLGDLKGVYIYGDYQSGKVWGLRLDPESKALAWRGELADTGLRLVSFGEGGAGEIYLVEMDRTNQIYRLEPNQVHDDGSPPFPRRLSETGLFASTAVHAPAPGVVPYQINASLWSDGAGADRLLAIPGDGRIAVGDDGRWRLPEGSVLARTVWIEQSPGSHWTRKRIETQVLHYEEESWRPYTYIWDDDGRDATLADPSGAVRTVEVLDAEAPGGRREQVYRVGARSECGLCHNPWVGGHMTIFGRQSASPAAFAPEQLDHADQLEHLSALSLFDRPPAPPAQRLADPYDDSLDLDARARSYLHVNCSHCHRSGAGGTADIVLAADAPLEAMKVLDARPLQGTFGLDDARIVAPGEPERSVLYYRACKLGGGRMPRIGSDRIDERGVRLLADWIAGMPGGGEDLAEIDLDGPESLDPHLATPSAALALVRRIDRGDLSEPAVRQVADRARAHPLAEVRDLFERFLPESERIRRLGDAIDGPALLALEGDAERGRLLFASASATSCASCHRVDGQGTEVGPDLSGIGLKYDRAGILLHILEPSREVAPEYAARSVALADGRVLVGLPVERNGSELILRDGQGELVRVPLDAIDEEAPQSASLMPEGLLRELTAQQAADLIEFLATRRAAPAEGP